MFRVPADGGEAVLIITGTPFRRPVGIAVSRDGDRIFVAGPEAGSVFNLPATGGSPEPIPGTESLAPRGVEVVVDSLYLTGKDGVFRTSVTGTAPVTAVLRGIPLADTDAVTVASLRCSRPEADVERRPSPTVTG